MGFWICDVCGGASWTLDRPGTDCKCIGRYGDSVVEHKSTQQVEKYIDFLIEKIKTSQEKIIISDKGANGQYNKGQWTDCYFGGFLNRDPNEINPELMSQWGDGKRWFHECRGCDHGQLIKKDFHYFCSKPEGYVDLVCKDCGCICRIKESKLHNWEDEEKYKT